MSWKWISAMGIKGWLLAALFVFIILTIAIIGILVWFNEFKRAAILAQVMTPIVGGIGVFLLAQRNELFSRQVEVASDTQASNQLAQGVDLLTRADNNGKKPIVAGIGGLYSLESLAKANPDDYGVQVMQTIVAYIRANAQKDELEKREKPSPLGEDVKTAFTILKRLYDRNKDDLIDAGKLKRWFFNSERRDDDLTFADTDFHMLDLKGIEWIDRVDLRRAQLQGADLSASLLQGANLNGAQLKNTILRKVQLQNANLNEACLRGADLQGANLQDAHFRRTQLQGAYLMEAQLQSADFKNADLQGTYFMGAQLHCSDLQYAMLEGADLGDAKLQGANLRHARLQGTDLRRAQLQGVCLSKAQLQGVSFRMAELQGADLSYSRLQGASLWQTQLQGADLSYAKLQGAYLNKTKLDYSQWNNVTIEIDKDKLKEMLENSQLEQDKIKSILEQFNKVGGSRGLWQPELARILFDGKIKPLKYSHKEIRWLKQNDKKIEWQEGWRKIFKDIEDKESLYYTAKGLIRNFVSDILEKIKKETLCTNGLRDAIKGLQDYEEIYKRLPSKYKDWLDDQPE